MLLPTGSNLTLHPQLALGIGIGQRTERLCVIAINRLARDVASRIVPVGGHSPRSILLGCHHAVGIVRVAGDAVSRRCLAFLQLPGDRPQRVVLRRRGHTDLRAREIFSIRDQRAFARDLTPLLVKLPVQHFTSLGCPHAVTSLGHQAQRVVGVLRDRIVQEEGTQHTGRGIDCGRLNATHCLGLDLPKPVIRVIDRALVTRAHRRIEQVFDAQRRANVDIARNLRGIALLRELVACTVIGVRRQITLSIDRGRAVAHLVVVVPGTVASAIDFLHHIAIGIVVPRIAHIEHTPLEAAGFRVDLPRFDVRYLGDRHTTEFVVAVRHRADLQHLRLGKLTQVWRLPRDRQGNLLGIDALLRHAAVVVMTPDGERACRRDLHHLPTQGIPVHQRASTIDVRLDHVAATVIGGGRGRRGRAGRTKPIVDADLAATLLDLTVQPVVLVVGDPLLRGQVLALDLAGKVASRVIRVARNHIDHDLLALPVEHHVTAGVQLRHLHRRLLGELAPHPVIGVGKDTTTLHVAEGQCFVEGAVAPLLVVVLCVRDLEFAAQLVVLSLGQAVLGRVQCEQAVQRDQRQLCVDRTQGSGLVVQPLDIGGPPERVISGVGAVAQRIDLPHHPVVLIVEAVTHRPASIRHLDRIAKGVVLGECFVAQRIGHLRDATVGIELLVCRIQIKEGLDLRWTEARHISRELQLLPLGHSPIGVLLRQLNAPRINDANALPQSIHDEPGRGVFLLTERLGDLGQVARRVITIDGDALLRRTVGIVLRPQAASAVVQLARLAPFCILYDEHTPRRVVHRCRGGIPHSIAQCAEANIASRIRFSSAIGNHLRRLPRLEAALQLLGVARHALLLPQVVVRVACDIALCVDHERRTPGLVVHRTRRAIIRMRHNIHRARLRARTHLGHLVDTQRATCRHILQRIPISRALDHVAGRIISIGRGISHRIDHPDCPTGCVMHRLRGDVARLLISRLRNHRLGQSVGIANQIGKAQPCRDRR